MVAMLRLKTATIKQPDEMYRRAPTYFTRRLQFEATAALFNQSVEEHIHNFRSHSQSNLNWDAVKDLYRAAMDMIIGKSTLGQKPIMSDSICAIIEMRNILKKVIEGPLENFTICGLNIFH